MIKERYVENKTDKDDGVFMPSMKAEDLARLKKAWGEQWDHPSEAPGFEGATPQALARALFNFGKGV